MSTWHRTFEIATRGARTYEITNQVEDVVRKSGLKSGIAVVFCPHTSCSLVLMENASPEARRDLETFLDKLVPPNADFEHHLEGEDDMPAHIKMALTRSSETIPFGQGRLLLGGWQGIYLWEHRSAPHGRTVSVSLVGE